MKKGLFSVLTLASVAACQPREGTLVNFAHLQHLTQRIILNDEPVSIVHVYADFPNYHWVDAAGEGIACVDDAARAAVVYLRAFELRRDTASLASAGALLRFVMAMQAADGEFYNFLLHDRTINRDGKTSCKSFGWWAGRAVWAMALGYRVMKDAYPAIAEELGKRVRRSLPHVDALVQKHGDTRKVQNFRIPEWLLYESGSDATAELVLGLIEFYRVTGDEQVKAQIRKLAEGMMVMQDGDIRTFPYGAHRSWETVWHAWGNGQTQALATAGQEFADTVMIQSAEREACGFYSRLLIRGFLKEWDFMEPRRKTEFEQIAYGIRPMAVGLLRLYDATGNQEYLKMAGLAASWFFGNNILRARIYDSATGRCFDGIRDSITINRNSGAESTIEALYTLLEIEQYPLARRYLSFHRSESQESGDMMTAAFRNDQGDSLTLSLDLRTGALFVR